MSSVGRDRDDGCWIAPPFVHSDTFIWIIFSHKLIIYVPVWVFLMCDDLLYDILAFLMQELFLLSSSFVP